MAAAMPASPAVASSAEAPLCRSPLRCGGSPAVLSFKKETGSASMSLSAWAAAGLAREKNADQPVAQTPAETAPFETLLRPFFPPQVFRPFSKRVNGSKTSEGDFEGSPLSASCMPPLKKARSLATTSPRLAHARATRLATSGAASVAKLAAREKRTETLCPVEQPECLETQNDAEPLLRGEGPQLACAETQMKEWILSVAAAVWQVRGSRLSEAYERELMALYDRPMLSKTSGTPPYTDVKPAEGYAALQEEVRRLGRRVEDEAEMRRECLTQVQQEHVRSLQRLRTSLLSRQREIRTTLQQLAALHQPQKRVAEKDRTAGAELVDRLRQLMDDQERRVTSMYVQQVNRLQETLQLLLTKRTVREGEGSAYVNSSQTESRDCVNGSSQDAVASGEGLKAAAPRATLSSKRGKGRKPPSPFCHSNSSLKRRSVCMLRGLACATRSDAVTVKKTESSPKRM
ncbi:conserved hypothetical protein [Neospora caninum Liverpool]|uniref:Uncharacterized protein n=1 Tax=Neospora caninum (strain Liverpool) TaxID=572307 RepID=F0VD81_NEOCL|nr:conserved hypothetical protein [Neospora caninum Liverpool]CBZ51596.1 conserved hypothetical protein [Neospora caninum Liverpool]CEL65547.1 TPA: hypothetical protein BN1204_013900 [Neospora caninum Liverpool]|eukprot:XP_003881629.1 conserved hypothetical protein [Neospora caninum Liverpool]